MIDEGDFQMRGMIDGQIRGGTTHNKVLPSSLVDWHQKEEIIKLKKCDLQGGNGRKSRPAAALNVR
jgi:hypothetical protein